MATPILVSIPFGDPAAADSIPVFRAPTGANGGGLTLVAAQFINQAATDAGTSFSLALHKYSNLGTPAVNGTIAAAIGGTATPWADGVPQSFTLVEPYNKIAAGESIWVVYAEQASGNPTRGLLMLHFLPGL